MASGHTVRILVKNSDIVTVLDDTIQVTSEDDLYTAINARYDHKKWDYVYAIIHGRVRTSPTYLICNATVQGQDTSLYAQENCAAVFDNFARTQAASCSVHVRLKRDPVHAGDGPPGPQSARKEGIDGAKGPPTDVSKTIPTMRSILESLS